MKIPSALLMNSRKTDSPPAALGVSSSTCLGVPAAAFALLLACACLSAADPAGFVYWPKGAPPDGKGVKFENHGLSISHRDKTGVAELHEKQADIFVVQSGQAVLQVGGEMVGGKTVGPGEIRGSSIQGGVKKSVGPGDVVHIAAKTPHRFLLDPGRQITYFTVKVDTP